LGQSVALAQSAAVLHPQAPLGSHTGPRGLPVQSTLVVQQDPAHRPVAGLQTEPAAQSALVEQPQVFVVVLHDAPRGLVAQSALVVHLGWHWCAKVLQPSLAGQSALVEQPQVFVGVFVALGAAPLHHAPWGLAAQSALVRHSTQYPKVVLHTPSPFVPAGLPAPGQSALVRHWTHRPVDVLQAVPNAPPAQSELDVQAATHPAHPRQVSPAGQSALVVHPTHRPVVALHRSVPPGLRGQSALLAQAFPHWANWPWPEPQTWPLAQSVIAMQPQTCPGKYTPPSPPPVRMPRQYVPPAALAQSAMVEHPHVCVVVSHTGPSGLVAQSALALHATQDPVETSHAVPVALPVQSESLLQRFSHWLPRLLCAGQNDPVGHSLVAVQPHLISTMPATTASWHTGPEADDAQSESTLHTQACVSVLQSGPSALVAQSALVLQPVVACTPASPDGDVVLELLLHPHRASVEMIPATIPRASLALASEMAATARVETMRTAAWLSGAFIDSSPRVATLPRVALEGDDAGQPGCEGRVALFLLFSNRPRRIPRAVSAYTSSGQSVRGQGKPTT
jgi:hypothetical protein